MAKRLLSGSWSSSEKGTPPSPPEIVREIDTDEMPDSDVSLGGESEEDEDMVQKILSEANNPTSFETPSKVTFAGLDSPSASTNDSEKDRDELIAKIRRLEMDVTQAQIDLTAEKTVRKKKERSLVKLAKELNKRSAQKHEMEKEVARLKTYVTTLETKLSATRMELGERVEAGEQSMRRFTDELEQAHQKYRDVCREHDSRVADMMKAHGEQTESLRRQIDEAAREADHLRSKLIKLEVREAERIAERAVEISGAMDDEVTIEELHRERKWKRLMVICFVASFSILYQVTGFSMDAICSPVMVGTRIHREATFEAPWWAPASLKEEAFGICGDRPRTSLSWSTSGGTSRIVAKTVGGETDKTLFERRGAAAAIVKVDRLELMMNKKGKVESIRLPWAL